MSQDDYVAINTNPEIAIVASQSSREPALATSVEELRRLDDVLTPRDRRLLQLRDDASAVSLVGRKIQLSQALALSNQALATLGYHVDAHAARATTLEDSDFARLGVRIAELPAMQRQADEVVVARTGGGVSLALGMARVFSRLPAMNTLLSYWYHFAIMFEALFVLTTIDTGTRIGRFLVQEFFAKSLPSLGKSTSKLGAVTASLLIVAGWSYFILTGTISTIWPMFGIANQLLACTALCIGTSLLLREAPKRKYALVTFVPLVAVSISTLIAGIQSIRTIFWPLACQPSSRVTGVVNVAVTTTLLACVAAVLLGSGRKWVGMLSDRE